MTGLKIAALVTGVNNGLRLAENDAFDVWELLSSGTGPFRAEGAQRLIGGEATVARIDREFDRLVRSRPDLVIFYDSGHADDHGFIVAGGERYGYARLLKKLRAIGCERSLVIIDACMSGALAELAARPVRIGGLGDIETVADPAWVDAFRRGSPGTTIIASARRDQYAWEPGTVGERNGHFTASWLLHARTLPGAGTSRGMTFVDERQLFRHVAFDLAAKGLPQTPVRWGGRLPMPFVRSEHDAVLGSARIVSVSTAGASLQVQLGTSGRRFLPCVVRASTYSQLTGGLLRFSRVYTPESSLTLEPVVLDASNLLLDDWHRTCAQRGYTIEWDVSVVDSWDRPLAAWGQALHYRAA